MACCDRQERREPRGVPPGQHTARLDRLAGRLGRRRGVRVMSAAKGPSVNIGIKHCWTNRMETEMPYNHGEPVPPELFPAYTEYRYLNDMMDAEEAEVYERKEGF